MNIRFTLVLLSTFILSGCLHFGYAVKKENSPIPYENNYVGNDVGDDHSDYEFDSNVYALGEYAQRSSVELSHLFDFYQRYQSSPRDTYLSSALDFELQKESGIEVLVDTIVLQHYSEAGDLLKPIAIESTMEKCREVVGCRGYFRQHYAEGLPKKIIEKVSFTLLIDCREEHIEYTIPLELKYHYSKLTELMSV